MIESSSAVLGPRTKAAWIDLGVLFVLFVLFAVVFGGAHTGTTTTQNGSTTVHSSGVGISLTGLPLVLFLVCCLAYYFAFEAVSGQTIGKRFMHLEVVSKDGGELTPGAVAIRTLGRIIDVLPAFYLVGWTLLRRRREPRQRLGDQLAGTTVVAAAPD